MVEPQTVLLLSALVSGLLGLVILATEVLKSHRSQGTTLWVLHPILGGAALVFFAFRGALHPALTILVANGLALIAGVSLHLGNRRYFQQRINVIDELPAVL